MTASTLNNGHFPDDAQSAAAVYLARGLSPIPLPPRSKDPGYPGWPTLRITPETLDAHFPTEDARNVGILNGDPSCKVLDVDLDCPEARRVAALLLPSTGWVFGRPTSPRSHWIYRCDRALAVAQEKFTDLDGAVLIELRGTGGLTVYPPSTHKGTGELIAWDRFNEQPAEVTLKDLQQAVREVAAVALLSRHWPTTGTRRIRTWRWSVGCYGPNGSKTKWSDFVEALTLATGDDEPRKRIQIVALTAAKQEQDAKTTGWTKLESMLGASGRDVVRLVREWLGMVPTAKPATKTKKRARRLDPYQPFPIEALPDPVAEYVRQGSVALGCDPGYLALPALCVMGSLIGNTRVIRLKGTWQEPSVFWSVIVGDSGTLKSPACTFAVKYLWKKQEQMLKAFQEAEAAYLKQLEAFKAAKKDGSEGAEPLEPTEKSIIADEFTVEKLITLLGDNPRYSRREG